jgi:uncharacterized protein (DUF2147 family)
MKRLSTILLFCVISVVASAQAKPDREKNGLRKSVQTVKTEVTEFTSKDGKSVEGARMPVQAVDYDERGNVVKRVDFNRDGSVAQTIVYSYDAQGRSTGYEDFTPGLNTPRKHIYVLASDGKQSEYKVVQPAGSPGDERYVYKYDANGNMIAEELYNKAQLISKNENVYDAHGRLISQVIYNPDGTVSARIQNTFLADGKPVERIRHDGDLTTYRVRYKYDDKGRLLERKVEGSFVDMDFTSENYTTGKVVFVYKGKDQPKEAITYNPDGSFRERVEFDYDSHGNWKKKTRKVRVAGKEVKQQIEYRTITYF